MTKRARTRLRYFPRLAALAVVLGAMAVPTGAPSPAAADGEQPALHLVPGKPVHVDGKALQVPGYAPSRRPQGAQTPENCRGIASSYCDVYPLVMEVPPGDILTSQFVVVATLNFDPGQTVYNIPEAGEANANEFALRIYYDPPCDSDGAPPCPLDETGASEGDDGEGDPYAASSATFVAPPLQVGVVQADLTRKMAVTVAFYYGQPEPYTLDVQLVKIQTESVPDLSGDQSIAVTSGSKPQAPSAPSTPAPAIRPTAAPAPAAPATAAPAAAPASPAGPNFGAGDVNGLDGVNGTSLNGDQLAGLFTGKAKAALPPPGKASAILLLLALLVLPVAALALPTGWMWRRRRSASL
jgi:hypothetical protein